MKNICLALIMVFAVSIASAAGKKEKKEVELPVNQPVMVTGTVIDQSTNEALVGVKIELEGTDQVTYTDFDGNYSFEDVKPGTYSITASYVSYDEKSLENVTVMPSNNKVEISLKSSN